MKVLMLAHIPPPMHGAAIVGQSIFNILKRNNIDVSIINLSTSSTVGEIGGVNSSKLRMLLTIYFTLIKEFLFTKYNKFYFSPAVTGRGLTRDSLFYFTVKLINLFRFNNKMQCIMHIHMQPDKHLSFIKRFLLKILFKGNIVIFADKSLINAYPSNTFEQSSVEAIPYYVKSVTLKEAALSRWERTSCQDKNEHSLLFIGHMIPSKGYQRALDIAKELSRANFNFKLNFAGAFGSSTDKDYFDSYILKNNLSNAVYYLGEIYGEEKEKTFLESDLIILPSYREQYPLTLPEAFSCGLPVVSTDTGAVAHIIGNNKGKVVKQEREDFICEFSKQVIEVCNCWGYQNAKTAIREFELNWSEKVFEEKFMKLILSPQRS